LPEAVGPIRKMAGGRWSMGMRGLYAGRSRSSCRGREYGLAARRRTKKARVPCSCSRVDRRRTGIAAANIEANQKVDRPRARLRRSVATDRLGPDRGDLPFGDIPSRRSSPSRCVGSGRAGPETMNCCQPSGRSGAVMEMAGTPGAMTCESFPTCTVREYAGSHARSFRQDTPAPAVTGPSLVTIARAAGRGCTSEVATAFYNRGLPCPPRGPTNGFPMPQTMKALVKRKPEQGIWMEEVPLPEVGPNEVL